MIEFDERETRLKDLDSLNGCHVNDKKINRGSTCVIFNKDIISFGKGLYII